MGFGAETSCFQKLYNQNERFLNEFRTLSLYEHSRMHQSQVSAKWSNLGTGALTLRYFEVDNNLSGRSSKIYPVRVAWKYRWHRRVGEKTHSRQSLRLEVLYRRCYNLDDQKWTSTRNTKSIWQSVPYNEKEASIFADSFQWGSIGLRKLGS